MISAEFRIKKLNECECEICRCTKDGTFTLWNLFQLKLIFKDKSHRKLMMIFTWWLCIAQFMKYSMNVFTSFEIPSIQFLLHLRCTLEIYENISLRFFFFFLTVAEHLEINSTAKIYNFSHLMMFFCLNININRRIPYHTWPLYKRILFEKFFFLIVYLIIINQNIRFYFLLQ